MKYEFYKIHRGKIHIYDPEKWRDFRKYDHRYLCSEYKVTEDEQIPGLKLDLIDHNLLCKRCLSKIQEFGKISPLFPDELFEI